MSTPAQFKAALLGLPVGTSANNLVQLDGSARLPAVDGSQLTNLEATLRYQTATLSYSGTVATDADEGSIFDLVATGDFTLANPANAQHGRKLEWRITASGADRQVTLDSKFRATSDSTVTFPFTIAQDTELILAVQYHSGRDIYTLIAFVPNNPIA